MKAILRENIGEAIVGLLVVVLAVWFVMFAWERTGGGEKVGSIHIAALFPNASGVGQGTDVRISGLKDKQTVHMRYADPSPWDSKKSPSARELTAWEASMKTQELRSDLEQYRRVSARTIFKLGETLANNNGGN